MCKKWYLPLLLVITLAFASLTGGCPKFTQDDLDLAYADGFAQGYDDGNEDGYNDGYDSGEDDGYVLGYNVGNEDGHVQGYDDGYDDGNFNGYIGGLADGYNQGYYEGWWELYYQTYGYNYSDIFLELFIITPSVGPGYNAVLTIRTLPYANCEITVEYLSGPSTADGLDDKISNSSGYVSWTWKVGTRTTAGSWPVTVTAHIGGEEITDTWYLTVT